MEGYRFAPFLFAILISVHSLTWQEAISDTANDSDSYNSDRAASDLYGTCANYIEWLQPIESKVEGGISVDKELILALQTLYQASGFMNAMWVKGLSRNAANEEEFRNMWRTDPDFARSMQITIIPSRLNYILLDICAQNLDNYIFETLIWLFEKGSGIDVIRYGSYSEGTISFIETKAAELRDIDRQALENMQSYSEDFVAVLGEIQPYLVATCGDVTKILAKESLEFILWKGETMNAGREAPIRLYEHHKLVNGMVEGYLLGSLMANPANWDGSDFKLPDTDMPKINAGSEVMNEVNGVCLENPEHLYVQAVAYVVDRL